MCPSKKVDFFLFLIRSCAQFKNFFSRPMILASIWLIWNEKKFEKGWKLRIFLLQVLCNKIILYSLWSFFISPLPLLARYSLVSFRYPALARTCTPMFFIRVVPVPIMEVVAHAVPSKNRMMTAMRIHPPVRWFFSDRELRSSDTFKFLPILN